MPVKSPLVFAAPKVQGVEDADIDPDGYIPVELLPQGIDVIVPLWPSFATQPGERDVLTIRYLQPGQPAVEIENEYQPADIKPEFVIHIDAVYLQIDGEGELWYEVRDTADHLVPSNHRKLTIDRVPIPNTLDEPSFPDAIGSYLNCSTKPPIWEGVRVIIPSLQLFKAGDTCAVLWRGYTTLNGSGVEFVRARKKEINPSLSDIDVVQGYSLVIQPYDVHIKPMERDSSAVVSYRIYRGRRLVGISKPGLVRIDRIVAGEELPCGP